MAVRSTKKAKESPNEPKAIDAPAKAPVAERSSAVDWSFIEEREGGSHNEGYVPKDSAGNVFGQSGVTIGCGVDLGQQGAPGLELWGADAGLIKKLQPYLGLRREAAVGALERAPLSLTDDETSILNEGARRAVLADVQSRYDRAAIGRRFTDLSGGAQTALISVAYQYGTRLDRRTPRFWNRALRGDERAMKAELMAFGDAYAPRRELEAGLIKLA